MIDETTPTEPETTSNVPDPLELADWVRDLREREARLEARERVLESTLRILTPLNVFPQGLADLDENPEVTLERACDIAEQWAQIAEPTGPTFEGSFTDDPSHRRTDPTIPDAAKTFALRIRNATTSAYLELQRMRSMLRGYVEPILPLAQRSLNQAVWRMEVVCAQVRLHYPDVLLRHARWVRWGSLCLVVCVAGAGTYAAVAPDDAEVVQPAPAIAASAAVETAEPELVLTPPPKPTKRAKRRYAKKGKRRARRRVR